MIGLEVRNLFKSYFLHGKRIDVLRGVSLELAAGGAARFSSAADKPVPGAKSDHKMTYYYDDEQKHPIPQSRIDAWLKSH